MNWEKVHRNTMLFMAGGALFYAGWISSAAHFNIKQRWEDAHKLLIEQTQTVPALKSFAGCEKMRAQIATKEAAKSEAGSDIDLRKIPNCPPAPKKAK